MLMFACVSINLYLIVIKTLFDYLSPFLCEIVLEASIILSLVPIYDLPSMCTTNHSIYLCNYVISRLCLIGIVCMNGKYVVLFPCVQLIM